MKRPFSRSARFALAAGALAVPLGMIGGRALYAQAAAARSQRPANHLAGSTSPYLLQHAHNPVDWYPWGPEAFAKAKREGKPIFLSIGYSSCHWCHVMERESFEDEGVAQLLNEHFVAIKVDREERPDLDEVYMAAVQLMTGRGGWPMSSFLTPEGKPFYGATYLPRTDFAELLRKVHDSWGKPDERKQIDTMAARVSEALGKTARAPEAGQVSPDLLRPAALSYLEQVDEEYGGFGQAPKFPPAMRLSLMLGEHRKRPDPKLLRAVTLTLDRMARGGMYDHLGGGFHRYSTDRKWGVPHFEKMLYDQALVAGVYLEAFRATKQPDYRRVATETLDFTLRELHGRDLIDPAKGGFWSTLDADSPGANGEREEGRYYTWTPAEVIAALGKEDGELFNRVYGVTEGGPVEGRAIPSLLAKPLSAWAKELKTSPAALEDRLEPLRGKLVAVREKRPRPSLDDKVLANWNGLMLRTLAQAYDVTGEARFRQAAEQTAGFLLTAMRKDGKLRHSYRAGKTQPEAFLEDYAYVTAGLLELHRATGEARWLKEAEALAHVMVADFWDEQQGTFAATPRGHEMLLARLDNAEDGATPSGQSVAALALVQLGRRTGDAELRDKGRRVLDTYAKPMRRTAYAMPAMLLAAQALFNPQEELASGKKQETVVASILSAPAKVAPGAVFEVAVQLTIGEGWHINAERPADSSLIATRVQPAAGGFQLVSAAYPTAMSLKASFSPKPLQVYAGKAVVRLKLKAPQQAGEQELRLQVRYQSCNNQLCERPVEKLVTLSLKVEP